MYNANHNNKRAHATVTYMRFFGKTWVVLKRTGCWKQLDGSDVTAADSIPRCDAACL